jgi:hypothetical protein
MIYALMMALVLLLFAAVWRRHTLQLPLFLLLQLFILLHLVSEMTTPLTLRF